MLFVLIFSLVISFILAEKKDRHHQYINSKHRGIKHALSCTANEAVYLASIFVTTEGRNGVAGANYRKYKFDGSCCPGDMWFEQMAQNQDTGTNGGVFINIGFNKGYNFAKLMNIFTPWNKVTPGVWHEHIPSAMSYEGCGACDDCKSLHTVVSNQESTNDDDFIFIGLDLNRRNIELVEKSIESLNNTSSSGVKMNGVRFYLTWAAASDHSGTMNITDCGLGATAESCSLGQGGNTVVSLMTVSDLVLDIASKHRHKHPVLEKVMGNYYEKRHKQVQGQGRDTQGVISTPPLIDMLYIDTEGHDALVLKGSSTLIEQQAIRVIAFEYHKYLPWGNMLLHDTMIFLSKNDYECFFQGEENLWYIGGSCWSDVYEFHQWTNILCVLKTDRWFESVLPFVKVPEDYIEKAKDLVIKYENHAVRASTGKAVFLISHGEKRLYKDGYAFLRDFHDWNNITTITGGELTFVPDGPDIY